MKKEKKYLKNKELLKEENVIKQEKRLKQRNLITSVMFVLMVAIFTVISLLKADTGFSDTENRVLAQAPTFSFESLFDGTFTNDYQTYVRDQFPQRNSFVAMRNYVEKIFGKSMINEVLICDDDYYIESHGRQNYESELANTNMEAIKSFADRYENELGSEHVSVMIVPTAQTVLTNKFTNGMYAYDQNIYLKKINNAVGDSVFVNTYDILKLHDDEYIYYKTDHHWTTYGAYLAYTQWAKDNKIAPYKTSDININYVSDEFFGTINNKLNVNMLADTIYSYTVNDVAFSMEYNMDGKKTNQFFDASFISSKDKYSYFFGGNPGLVDITSEININKKLLIIKDSYANCIAPVYAAHFEKTYVLDLRSFNMSIDEFIDEYEITDILVLYNVDSFATDKYIKRIK